MKFTATREELTKISEIADRAIAIADKFGLPTNKMNLVMDLEVAHSNDTPLDLQALAAADDTNLAHDVFGIRSHLNRRTGKLEDGFAPRYSAPQTKPAFTVKSHDGTVKHFATRDAAIKFIKEHLDQWMNPSDRLAWGYLNATDLPDHAQIITEHGEPCDAYATLL